MVQLQKRLARGETEAFVELYDMLGHRLMRYLTARLGPTDAPDVLQEIFLRLFRYHRRLGKSTNLTAYVFLTARNEANRWQKKKEKRNTSGKPAEEFALATEMATADSVTERNELIGILLNQISIESREIVQLKIFSELTFAEIARMLKQNESTVATRYRRGISKMQLKLDDLQAAWQIEVK